MPGLLSQNKRDRRRAYAREVKIEGSRTVRRIAAPLTQTVGRERDEALTMEALGRSRLVTLVGPGGVGKTRLAVDVARRLATGYRRGVVMVGLAGVRAADDVAGAIVTALDLTVDRRAVLDVLAAAGGVDQLVVLDNCEHVIDAVASLVVPLMSGGERLRVLATSREPIGVDGETIVRVNPLPVDTAEDAAVKLFAERARMVAPHEPLDEDDALRVVQRLDGLPIAIEMAAARLRTMTLGDLEASLARGLAVLASSRRDVEDRQRTVTSLLSWSEALIEPRLRDTWFAVGTCAGPVSADDVVELTGDPGSFEALARLVDQSLVTVVPSGATTRYSVLQLVGDYARERLQGEGLMLDVERRHAEWVLDMVRRVDAALRTADEPEAARRFDRQFGEVRDALRWSFDNDIDIAVELLLAACQICRQSHRPELAAWAELAVRLMPSQHPETSTVLAVLAAGLSIIGRLPEARIAGEASLERAPDGRGAALALDALGDVALYEGRLADAEAIYTRGWQIARVRGDELLAATTLTGAAISMGYGGRAADSLAVLAGSESTSISGQGWLWYAHGESVLDADPERAVLLLDRAFEAAERAGNRYLAEVSLLSAATVSARTADPAAAAARVAMLLDRYRDGGDAKHLLTTLRNVVPLLVRLGRYEAAAVLHGSVADHTLAPTFGPEADRLEAAADRCIDELGVDRFGALTASGTERGLDEALVHARDALTETDAEVPAAVIPHVDPVVPRPGVVPDRSTATLERRGEVWHVVYLGEPATIVDLKGMHDIAALLRQPGVEVHALELVGGYDVDADAGPALDSTARATYRARIAELRATIDHARERGHAEQALTAEDELDALVAELSASLGLGGRPRERQASYERARSTVTNRIRTAVRKIESAQPQLGRHLRNSIHTGTWSSYRPEGDIQWNITSDVDGDRQPVPPRITS